MSGNSNTKFYNDFPWIVKFILWLFLGNLFGIIYRILRFVESKTTSTLVVAILCVIPVANFVIWIIDLISIIKNGTYTFYAN